VSNFDDLLGVEMVVKINTKALFSGPYTAHQERLYGRVVLLRDREELTFDAIAKILTKSGTRSARGCLLAAEHVYSIYKKGKLREQRLESAASINGISITFVGRMME
jgi:hypothetical protein